MAAKICSSLLMGDLVLNRSKYESDPLAAMRKACKTLATELGMTRADLSPALQHNLIEFMKADQSRFQNVLLDPV